MAMLETKNLTKKYGKVQALDGINIRVEEGEVFGFIGPNGAGKSTTLKILLGMLKATSGKAQIFGQDVWKDAVAIHERIAYVPGDVNLWPNLTGGEVIDLFTKLRGGKQTGKRDELIEKFSLDPSKKCRTYSKGNRQKVSLIAAFCSDADLYLLDEPTSGLDPLMERVFQDCVIDVKNQGKSVLLSSHILSEVERLCDRVGIIREGRMIETGTLAEMRHLTRISLLIETKERISDLVSRPGVHTVEEKQGALTFLADADRLDEIMSYVSAYGLTRLESSPPTLEDLFMRHYEGGGEQ